MPRQSNSGLITFFALFFLTSCVKDKPVKENTGSLPAGSTGKVYVVNEGGFGYGNASVTLYDPASGQIVEDIYKAQNNSDVGDVAQSLSQIGNRFYLVVNNSGKVLVCDAAFKKTGQISGLSSPRYLLPVTNQKTYISDYNAGAVSIVDLNSNLKTGSIPCPGWTERMTLIYNKAFVTNLRKKYLYVINTTTDLITDSVEVGLNAAGVVLDKNDRLWVLSGGDKPNNQPGRLTRIHPLTQAVEASFLFPAGASPDHLSLNGTKDTLWYLSGDIFRMTIQSPALPDAPAISAGTRNFYGLGVNPRDYTIYAADALDYAQRANVYIYTPLGTEKAMFKAGINANGFYFE